MALGSVVRTKQNSSGLICPECGGQLIVRSGKYNDFLGCSNFPQCKLTHSLHEDGTPMGIPADANTRRARRLVHERMDAIWMAITLAAWTKGYKKSRFEARSQMYLWLGSQLNLTEQECHVGRFDYERCMDALNLLEQVTNEDVARWAEPFDWLVPAH